MNQPSTFHLAIDAAALHDDPCKGWIEHQWGFSKHLYLTPAVDLAVAYGFKGGTSSFHHHGKKCNSFIVVSGIVHIRYERCASTLFAGNCCSAKDLEPHAMYFETDAVLYEVYTAVPNGVVDIADIDRKNDGSPPTDPNAKERFRQLIIGVQT